MSDRIAALLAFALFLGFFGILVFSVKRVDMAVVVAIGVALAGYDLWRQAFAGRR